MARSVVAAKQARTQAERRDEAERRILEAAIRLLVERGYDRFSLADVGEVAGYSRGLPGHYFGRKEDLLSQVAMFIVSRYYEAIIDTDAFQPGLPRVIARIRRYIEGFGSRGHRALNVLFGEARVHPTLKRTITELNQNTRTRWQTEIQAGIKAGNVRPDVNAEAIGAMIHAFLRGQSTFADLDPGYDVNTTTESLVESLLTLLSPERKRGRSQ